MTATTSNPTATRPMVPPRPPAPPARLRLRADTRRRGALDGGWWPRSRDPDTELPGLLTALGARHGRLTRIMLNLQAWHPRPRRLGIDGRIVRVDWYGSLDPDLLIVTSANGDRTDLLVVPPEVTAIHAAAAMGIATDPRNTFQPAEILAEAGTLPSRPATIEPLAEARWVTDGGRVLV